MEIVVSYNFKIISYCYYLLIENSLHTVHPEFQYGLEYNLDFEILLQQRQRHEAYTSKQLEQKFKSVSTRTGNAFTTNIQPNKASHFVAYFTKNECPEQ